MGGLYGNRITPVHLRFSSTILIFVTQFWSESLGLLFSLLIFSLKNEVLAVYLIPFWVSLEQTIFRTIFFPKYLSKRPSFFRPLEKGLLLQPHIGLSYHI